MFAVVPLFIRIRDPEQQKVFNSHWTRYLYLPHLPLYFPIFTLPVDRCAPLVLLFCQFRIPLCIFTFLVSRMLPQRNFSKAARVADTVPRDRFLKTFAGFVISSLVRGNIRRGNTNMDSIQSLLEEYLPIISPEDQEHILLNFNQ
jgi:hypothetical protein